MKENILLIIDEKYKRLIKRIANIIINDLMKHSNKKKCKINELGLNPYDIYWLASLIEYEILSSTKISNLINYYIENGGNLKEIITLLDFWPKYNNDELEKIVNKIISENSKIVKQIKSGKYKIIGSLIGKIKQIDKSVDSKEAMYLLKEKLINSN